MIIECRTCNGNNRYVMYVNWVDKKTFPTFGYVSYSLDKYGPYNYKDPMGIGLMYSFENRIYLNEEEIKKKGVAKTNLEIRVQLIFFDIHIFALPKVRQIKKYTVADKNEEKEFEFFKKILALNRFLEACFSPLETFKKMREKAIKKAMERKDEEERQKALRQSAENEAKRFHDTINNVINVTSRFAITCLTINQQGNHIYDLLANIDSMNLTQLDRKLFKMMGSSLHRITTDIMKLVQPCCEIVRDGKKTVAGYDSVNEYFSEVKTNSLINAYSYITKADLVVSPILVSITQLILILLRIRFVLYNRIFVSKLTLMATRNKSINDNTISFIVFTNELIKEINELICLTLNKLYFQYF